MVIYRHLNITVGSQRNRLYLIETGTRLCRALSCTWYERPLRDTSIVSRLQQVNQLRNGHGVRSHHATGWKRAHYKKLTAVLDDTSIASRLQQVKQLRNDHGVRLHHAKRYVPTASFDGSFT